MAATSRNPGTAATRPSRGTWSSASLMTVMRTLSVSSGMRLISSTYSSEPSRRAATSGPSWKMSGVYPSARTRAGSKWPTRRAGVSSALPSTNSKPTPNSSATARSSVDLPVPGGPSMRTWRPASRAASTSSSSRWRPTRRSLRLASAVPAVLTASLIDHDTADVVARPHVVVAVVHAVERVGLGHEPVEVELALAPELEQLGDVGAGVGRAEQRADDLLLHEREVEEADVGGHLQRRVDVGDDDPAALGGDGEGAGQQLARADAHGHDRLVGHPPPRRLGDGGQRLLERRRGVGGAELHRLL